MKSDHRMNTDTAAQILIGPQKAPEGAILLVTIRAVSWPGNSGYGSTAPGPAGLI